MNGCRYGQSYCQLNKCIKSERITAIARVIEISEKICVIICSNPGCNTQSVMRQYESLPLGRISTSCILIDCNIFYIENNIEFLLCNLE